MNLRLLLFVAYLAFDGTAARYFDSSKNLKNDQSSVDSETYIFPEHKIGETEAESPEDDVTVFLPKTQIQYVIDGDFSTSAHAVIMSVMDNFNVNTCVQFVPYTSGKAKLHITSHNDGCHGSSKYTQNSYYLNLQEPKCFASEKTVVNELMQALEFLQNQNKNVHGKNRSERSNKIHGNNLEGPHDSNKISHDSQKNPIIGEALINDDKNKGDKQIESLDPASIERINRIYFCVQQSPLHENDHEKHPNVIVDVPSSSPRMRRYIFPGNLTDGTASQENNAQMKHYHYETITEGNTVRKDNSNNETEPVEIILESGETIDTFSPEEINRRKEYYYYETITEGNTVREGNSNNETEPVEIILGSSNSTNGTSLNENTHQMIYYDYKIDSGEDINKTGEALHKTDSGEKIAQQNSNNATDLVEIILESGETINTSNSEQNNRRKKYYYYETITEGNTVRKDNSNNETEPVEIILESGETIDTFSPEEINQRKEYYYYENITEGNTVRKENSNNETEPVEIILGSGETINTFSPEEINRRKEYYYYESITEGNTVRKENSNNETEPVEIILESGETINTFSPEEINRRKEYYYYENITEGNTVRKENSNNETEPVEIILGSSNSTNGTSLNENTRQMIYYDYKIDSGEDINKTGEALHKTDSGEKIAQQNSNNATDLVEIILESGETINTSNSEQNNRRKKYYYYETITEGNTVRKENSNNKTEPVEIILESGETINTFSPEEINRRKEYHYYESITEGNTVRKENSNNETEPVEIILEFSDSTNGTSLKGILTI